MKPARIVVLGVAVAAGIAAAFLASGSKPPVIRAAAAGLLTDDVLVAAKELNFGAIIGEADLRWDPGRRNISPRASSAKAPRRAASRN